MTVLIPPLFQDRFILRSDPRVTSVGTAAWAGSLRERRRTSFCSTPIPSLASAISAQPVQEGKQGWVAVGQACQQFALQVTALGLKHAFINQPVEVARLRPDLAALAGIPGRRPDIVMRFGFGPTLPYSMRRPVEAVIVA